MSMTLIWSAIRYSKTECYNRGTSVSIIKNKRKIVLSRRNVSTQSIIPKNEQCSPCGLALFILGNYRLFSAFLLYLILKHRMSMRRNVPFIKQYWEKGCQDAALVCLCLSKLSKIHIIDVHIWQRQNCPLCLSQSLHAIFISVAFMSIITPYFRISRPQMSSGTLKISKLSEIWVGTINKSDFY